MNALTMSTRRHIQPLSSGSDGALFQHVGRYAREAVATAFEMVGGVERLADWADKNYSEFATKLLPKIITREVEVGATEGVEELLRRLDAGEHAKVIEHDEEKDNGF